MPSYIQNYGFTKTLFKDNDHNTLHNEIKWQGDYDGKIAHIDMDVNDNGNRELLSIQLNNNDIRQLFGIQPVQVPLDKRLVTDFLYNKSNKPIALEGALIKRKSRRYRKKSRKNTKRRKTRKLY